MNTITSHRLAKLILRFFKEYGLYGDFYCYFKKYYPVYAEIKGGFHTYINNQVIEKRYHCYDASLLFSVILGYYADWLLDNKKDAFNIFYDVCGLLNIYLDENGCNNGTTITPSEGYKDLSIGYPF